MCLQRLLTKGAGITAHRHWPYQGREQVQASEMSMQRWQGSFGFLKFLDIFVMYPSGQGQSLSNWVTKEVDKMSFC